MTGQWVKDHSGDKGPRETQRSNLTLAGWRGDHGMLPERHWRGAKTSYLNMFGNLAESLATDLSSLGDGGGLVAKSCPTLATPWTIVLQVPLNVGFSRQEYCHFLLQGIFPTQELNKGSHQPYPPPFSQWIFNE